MVNLNQLLTGAEFVLGCQIGGGLVVKHPNGIVIGKGAVIGRDCTLLHQVTVGERYLASAGGGVYPTIGDRVTLGAKSSILGDLHLGDDVTVGAHALVLADVPSGVTVRGVHASSAGDG
ncbi:MULTISPECIES: serine O-acetyltransferase [unclassified Blastococcus]